VCVCVCVCVSGSGTTSALDLMRNARMKLLAGAVTGEASSSSLAHADAGVHTQKDPDSCTAHDLLDAFCRYIEIYLYA